MGQKEGGGEWGMRAERQTGTQHQGHPAAMMILSLGLEPERKWDFACVPFQTFERMIDLLIDRAGKESRASHMLHKCCTTEL
jgi:hypothetical protein